MKGSKLRVLAKMMFFSSSRLKCWNVGVLWGCPAVWVDCFGPNLFGLFGELAKDQPLLQHVDTQIRKHPPQFKLGLWRSFLCQLVVDQFGWGSRASLPLYQNSWAGPYYIASSLIYLNCTLDSCNYVCSLKGTSSLKEDINTDFFPLDLTIYRPYHVGCETTSTTFGIGTVGTARCWMYAMPTSSRCTGRKPGWAVLILVGTSCFFARRLWYVGQKPKRSKIWFWRGLDLDFYAYQIIKQSSKQHTRHFLEHMEVEHGCFEGKFILQTGGFPLPC